MTLKKRIMDDLIQSMKNKDVLRKGVLQLLKAGMENAEKTKRSDLEETEELAIVYKELKQTRDSLNEATKAKRSDIVEMETAKIAIIESYLPKQLTKEEITTELQNLGIVKGMKMGDAMKIAKPALAGKAENALVSQVVKSLIS